VKKIMTVVVDLGGRCFRLCALFWDSDNLTKVHYFYRIFKLLRKKLSKERHVLSLYNFYTSSCVCMNCMFYE
jgi:hypothetical protein